MFIKELLERDKSGSVLVKCKCDFCGNYYVIRRSQLKKNISCGCRKGHRHINKIKIEGDVAKIFDNHDNFALVDTEDLDKLSKYYWYRESRGYWIASENNNIYYLHKFVLNVGKESQVDHICGKKYDNRKSQLRKCTIAENQRNRRLSKKNKTGVIGVYLSKNNSFIAKVSVKGKEIRLGTYKTIEEAIDARNKGVKKYYKEFGGCQYVSNFE